MNFIGRIFSLPITAIVIVCSLPLFSQAQSDNTRVGTLGGTQQQVPNTKATKNSVYTAGRQYIRTQTSGQMRSNAGGTKFPLIHGRAWKTCTAPGYGPSLGEGVDSKKSAVQNPQTHQDSQQQRSNYVQEFHWPSRSRATITDTNRAERERGSARE